MVGCICIGPEFLGYTWYLVIAWPQCKDRPLFDGDMYDTLRSSNEQFTHTRKN